MLDVDIDGLDNLEDAFDGLEDAVYAGARAGVRKNMRRIVSIAKQLAPVGKVHGGALRNSFFKKVERKHGDIIGTAGNVSDHAEYVELGTGRRGAASPSPPKSPEQVQYKADWPGMDAQPYLYPALKLAQSFLQADVGDAIDKEVGKLGTD